MGLFNGINTSGSALSSERLRMDVISKNIANANTTKTENGMPYRRQVVVVKSATGKKFSDYMDVHTGNGKTDADSSRVEVDKIIEDKSPFEKKYNPGHPDADSEGYVLTSNVNVVKEMVDMITAMRAYEANVTSLNNTKSMMLKALEISK
ncbi:flagellar basal-body rod protein FlgC [Peptoclostridium litorale DSM 5388]|uniref:Flagellar basal-body rod protein FlgC n=1 Tax=Peptoclostridium litorale DSM 5388 TaxID=1121324 RepID=A0A069RLV2_PEPLI|nr:flagellar basal body rod protein FlgC [Peptoclostridium litorale]KDR95157.1 flagellar basal-body rod protein FlgC [Peptoclostridium litorale DSM 5388]SIN74092.1 flagellar basal-body rod protein FlgC [Peptoclostridium litorale DSM 5388]